MNKDQVVCDFWLKLSPLKYFCSSNYEMPITCQFMSYLRSLWTIKLGSCNKSLYYMVNSFGVLAWPGNVMLWPCIPWLWMISKGLLRANLRLAIKS